MKKSVNIKKAISMQMFLHLHLEHEVFLFAIGNFFQERKTEHKQKFILENDNFLFAISYSLVREILLALEPIMSSPIMLVPITSVPIMSVPIMSAPTMSVPTMSALIIQRRWQSHQNCHAEKLCTLHKVLEQF